MFNPATLPRDTMNVFTNYVLLYDKQGWPLSSDGLSRWVKLRNGMIVRPKYQKAEDEYCEDSFVVNDPFLMYWNLDGTSVTSRDYDMMEMVTK